MPMQSPGHAPRGKTDGALPIGERLGANGSQASVVATCAPNSHDDSKHERTAVCSSQDGHAKPRSDPHVERLLVGFYELGPDASRDEVHEEAVEGNIDDAWRTSLVGRRRRLLQAVLFLERPFLSFLFLGKAYRSHFFPAEPHAFPPGCTYWCIR